MINGELIVDNFAGGGGASTGIEMATGHSVDIAINHDIEAIRMHKANHPSTKHYCESVWNVDPIKACKDHMELLQQLADSKAKVNFNQGIDARFITEENAKLLKQINISMLHFAFDFMKNEKRIVRGLEIAKEILQINDRIATVYILTNYDTTIEQDLYRVQKIKELGYQPDVRIYRRETLQRPHILHDLQRWANNRFIYRSCEFMDYVPRADGKTIRELYFERGDTVAD